MKLLVTTIYRRTSLGAFTDSHLAVSTDTGRNYPTVDIPSTSTVEFTMTHFTYTVNQTNTRLRFQDQALVDRGANGCVFGGDVRPFACPATMPRVDVSGFDDHRQTDMPIVSAGGVVQTQLGPAIAIIHHGAAYGRGKSILSPAQMESFGVTVMDRNRMNGGRQCIITPDGYIIPIAIRKDLPYIRMRPFTDDEWDELPHVLLTSEEEWVPGKRDNDPEEDDEDWADAL